MLLLNHSVIIKSSSDDKILVELVVDFWEIFFFENKIQIVDNVKGHILMLLLLLEAITLPSILSITLKIRNV